MPCFHCGTRQTDPDHGPSPWKRGVCHDRQVLICPDCQRSGHGVTDLDHCDRCGANDLICRLGEIECRTCGSVRTARPEREVVETVPPTGRPGPSGRPDDPGALSYEVAQALDRVLGHRRAR